MQLMLTSKMGVLFGKQVIMNSFFYASFLFLQN